MHHIEYYKSCSSCGTNYPYDCFLDDLTFQIDFSFCPACGKLLKEKAMCSICSFVGTRKKITNHRCYCKKHKEQYKRFSNGIKCPICRKEQLSNQAENVNKQLNDLSKYLKKQFGGDEKE